MSAPSVSEAEQRRACLIGLLEADKLCATALENQEPRALLRLQHDQVVDLVNGWRADTSKSLVEHVREYLASSEAEELSGNYCYNTLAMERPADASRSPFALLKRLVSVIREWQPCCVDYLLDPQNGCFVHLFAVTPNFRRVPGVATLSADEVCARPASRVIIKANIVMSMLDLQAHVHNHYIHLYEQAPEWVFESLVCLAGRTVAAYRRQERTRRLASTVAVIPIVET